MKFTICEPILHNSAGRSFMNQVPFKIYRADFELKDGVLWGKYYYNKVNRKYKFRQASQYSTPPVLYEFLNTCTTDCGIININLNKHERGTGLWVIEGLLKDNLSAISNYCYTVRMHFSDGKMFLSIKDNTLEIEKLKVSVCIVNHTTVIGSGLVVLELRNLTINQKWQHRYSKCKKALKELLTGKAGGDPTNLTPLIEKALIGGYRKVAEDSEALQKTYKESVFGG